MTDTTPPRRGGLLRRLGRRRAPGVEDLPPLRINLTATIAAASAGFDEAHTRLTAAISEAGTTIAESIAGAQALSDTATAAAATAPRGETGAIGEAGEHGHGLEGPADAVVEQPGATVAAADSPTGPVVRAPRRDAYTVTFGRVKGTGADASRAALRPLEATAALPDDLVEPITRHVQTHTGDRAPLQVTVDPEKRGGLVRRADQTIVTFTYTRRGSTR